jgi:hypothetical protein
MVSYFGSWKLFLIEVHWSQETWGQNQWVGWNSAGATGRGISCWVCYELHCGNYSVIAC